MSNSELKHITREAIALALIELCQNKAFSEVTISEITEKAGVSRMAFYRNFTNKEDVLVSYLDYIFDMFIREADYHQNRKNLGRVDNLIAIFNYFSNYRKFFFCLIKIGFTDIVLAKIKSFLLEYFKHDNSLQYYYLISYAGSLYSIYQEWISHYPNDEIKDISTVLSYVYSDKIMQKEKK